MVGCFFNQASLCNAEERFAETIKRLRTRDQQLSTPRDVVLQRIDHLIGHGVLFGRHHDGKLRQPRQQCPLVHNIHAEVVFQQGKNRPLHRGNIQIPHQILAGYGAPEVMLGMEHQHLRDGFSVLA